jgi:hypothetical protein
MKTRTEYSSTVSSSTQYESCEECAAPLDPQQRYCVECAARRGNGANPSSRYFAAMSKRARRPVARPAAKAGGSGSRAAAVGFFALLPIAVAIGVVVGRSGSDGGENEALLEALRNQNAAAVAVTPSAGAATAAAGTKKGKSKQDDEAATKGDGKVVAKTSNGTVHQVTGFEPSAQKEEEDTKLVEGNVKQTGSTYIKAQQNLPDVIVVGGDPGSAPAPTAGSRP